MPNLSEILRENTSMAFEEASCLMESLPEKIIITRLKDGKIVHANRRFLRAIGFRKADLIGKKTSEVSGRFEHPMGLHENAAQKTSLKNENIEIGKESSYVEIKPKLMDSGFMMIDGEECMVSIALDRDNHPPLEVSTVINQGDQLAQFQAKTLLNTVESLQREISERKQKEKRLLKYQERLRALTLELIMAEERERKRIANNLQEGIGQILAVSKIKLETLQKSIPVRSHAGALNSIRELIEETIQETRILAYDLSPPVLHELGLEAALESLVHILKDQSDMRITFHDDGKSKPVDEVTKVLLFRAFREVLLHIVRNSDAMKLKVSIRRKGTNIRIEIRNDGDGIDTRSESGFFELNHIRNRLRHLGGRLEIVSHPGGESRALIIAPVCSNRTDQKKLL